MKEVIIYGGAFNPPTKAHQSILEALAEIAEKTYGEVWLLPSGEREDKTIGLDPKVRVNMCEALKKSLALNQNIVKIQTFELFAKQQTNTYVSAKKLAQKFPDTHFTWVFGGDSLHTMPSWPHGKKLMAEIDMLIVPRPGTNTPPLPNRAQKLSVDLDPMSSTEVRRAILEGKTYHHLVPNEIIEIIELHFKN